MSLSDKKIGREIPYEIDKYCYYETDVKDTVKELIKYIAFLENNSDNNFNHIHNKIKSIFGEKLTGEVSK